MTIYRMIRTVGISDPQEQLNEMVRCLEKGDHVYIQDVDPLTPEYEMPDVTPDQYKATLKKYFGARLLKDHWKGFTQWDYYYLKEEPKPKPMEYPPEYIDTEKKEESKADTKKKKNGLFSFGNNKSKKTDKDTKKDTPQPTKPTEPPKVTFDILNEEESEPQTEPKPRGRKPKAILEEQPEVETPVETDGEPATEQKPRKTIRATKRTRAKRVSKQPEENVEDILRHDEEMNQKIQNMVNEYNGHV